MDDIKEVRICGRVIGFTEFNVKRDRKSSGGILCCEIELVERRRSFYRFYLLHYEPDWFRLHGARRDDYEAVRNHAWQWTVRTLEQQRNQLDLSNSGRAIEVFINR